MAERFNLRYWIRWLNTRDWNGDRCRFYRDWFFAVANRRPRAHAIIMYVHSILYLLRCILRPSSWRKTSGKVRKRCKPECFAAVTCKTWFCADNGVSFFFFFFLRDSVRPMSSPVIYRIHEFLMELLMKFMINFYDRWLSSWFVWMKLS